MLKQAKRLLSDHRDMIGPLHIGQRGSGTGMNATIHRGYNFRQLSPRGPRVSRAINTLGTLTKISDRIKSSLGESIENIKRSRHSGRFHRGLQESRELSIFPVGALCVFDNLTRELFSQVTHRFSLVCNIQRSDSRPYQPVICSFHGSVQRSLFVYLLLPWITLKHASVV